MKNINTLDFALFSATIYRFFPHLSWETHERLFEEYLTYHSRYNYKIEDVEPIRGKFPEQPGLLTTFHLGNHVQIPYALVEANIDFDILIDRSIYYRYEEPLKRANESLVQKGKKPVQFYFSDDPKLIFRIKELIHAGRHLLIFADGNGGQRLKDPKQELVKVPFFASHLWVRKGIPVLAKLFNIPIYPLMPETYKTCSFLEFTAPLYPLKTLTYEDAILSIMRSLYQQLEEFIASNPMLWECWSYLYRNGMIQVDEESKPINYKPAFSGKHMLKIFHQGENLWVDRKHFAVIKNM